MIYLTLLCIYTYIGCPSLCVVLGVFPLLHLGRLPVRHRIDKPDGAPRELRDGLRAYVDLLFDHVLHPYVLYCGYVLLCPERYTHEGRV